LSDEHVTRELARARVLTSHGHTRAALEIVAGLVDVGEGSLEVRRFHAQLLGVNGHHAASLAAYDAYLAIAPGDVDARREQARVAGRAHQFERALRLYAAIDQQYPSDAAARAEAEAKRLFYASRWRDAERAYAHWLEVEPRNEEAAFEYAETLVAQGRFGEARHVYDRLAHQPQPYEIANVARRTLEERSDPSGVLGGMYASSNGYGGQRRLEWSEATGTVVLPMAGDARHKLELSGSSLIFSNDSFRLPAYAGRALASTSAPWGALQGALSIARGDRDLANWQGHAEVDVAVRHDVGLRVALARTALLDNLSAVRDGMAAWGPAMTVMFATSDTDLAVAARANWVDSNLEKAAAVTVRQRVRRGTDEVRLIGDVAHNGWQTSDLRYFSPESFTKVDAGFEWTRWLRVPRFRMDRRSFLSVRYLAGVDSEGEVYHQPHVRFSVEHRQIAVETEASWVASPVYRAAMLRLGVRIGG
jgi:tetratricopeptide (TPR) repeat protein